MAVASKCFRLALAILFVYNILRDRAIFVNAARWRLGTKKQGCARLAKKIAKCVSNRNCLRFLLAMKFAAIGE